jgi:general stress protein CsbA
VKTYFLSFLDISRYRRVKILLKRVLVLVSININYIKQEYGVEIFSIPTSIGGVNHEI